MKQGCGAFCLLLLLGIGGLLFWTRSQAPALDRVRVPVSKLPPQEQTRRRQEARQLEDQVRDIRRAGADKQSKRFTLEITDEQLNTILQERVDLSKFPVRDLVVGFEPGRVAAEGEVNLNGFKADATLTGTVELKNGKLIYVTESLQAAGVPIPGDAKNKLDAEVSKQLNRALQNAPGRVDEVRLEQGKMIVSGQTD